MLFGYRALISWEDYTVTTLLHGRKVYRRDNIMAHYSCAALRYAQLKYLLSESFASSLLDLFNH